MTSLSYSGSWTNDQYVGTTVDPTGLSFTVTKIDGTTESVSPQAHTPTTWGETAGTQTCTFTYTDGYDSVSCEVEATVLPVFTGISISGTPATQRANTAIDTTGLTVYANYSDGSHVDVTSDADIETDDGSDTWGECIAYDDPNWVYSGLNHKLVASYIGPDDEEYTAETSPFNIEGEISSGGNFELTIGIGEYKTLDTPHLGMLTDPWNGDEQDPEGYLIDGAAIGTPVYMVFTKTQYDNDTPVKLEAEEPPAGNSLQEVMTLLGPLLEADSSNPGLGTYYTSNPEVLRTFSIELDNWGTPNSEFVIVIGTLANVVTAGGTIKKTDFANGYSYYNLKIVESAP